MRIRFVALLVVGLLVSTAAVAQDSGNPPPEPGSGLGSGSGQGRGGWGGMMGRGVGGTVTEVAADHFTIKSMTGEIYTVHFSANTRILQQPPQPERGSQGGMRTPPQEIKATEVHVGDAIMANGEVDSAAKSVGAVVVMKIDPERAREMREMQANFGKTWLAGRVTAVNETKITLESPVDNAEHAFVADENTSFRKRRDPVTLADVQVGDTVRVEGAVKEGVFVASSVSVMGPMPHGGPTQREGPPPQ